jgi:hypothetical protein
MEVVMKLIAVALTAFTLGLVSFETAQAQRYTNYRVCAVYNDARTASCAFNTMEQCYASVSGRGGWCEANVDYQSPGRRRSN